MKCIAICGDSASGKTRLANWLGIDFYAFVLECDRYHKWARNDPHWNHMTQLNPLGNDLNLLTQDIIDLKNGHSIVRQEYDHETGTFTKPKCIFPDDTNLVVCGLHTLMCPLELFDVTIFLDTAPDLKLKWKIERDVKKRGYTLDAVMKQIERRRGEYEKYIEPLKDRADIVVRRSEDSLEIIVQRERENVQKVIETIKSIG